MFNVTKTIFFGLFFLLAAAAGLVIYFNKSATSVGDINHEIIASGQIIGGEVVSANPKYDTEVKDLAEITPNAPAAVKGAKEYSIYGTAQEEAEVIAWCSARAAKCAMEQQDQKIYESYDTAALESLANGGDIRAMVILADRYAQEYIDNGESEKGFELAQQLFLKAASYGSTDALLRLGITAETSIYKTSLEGRDRALEPLAYYEVAAMRGDRIGKLLPAEHYRMEKQLVLTEKDLAYLETRAEEIYQDLQRRRHELGLGEFDNNVPESVNRYFSRIQVKQNFQINIGTAKGKPTVHKKACRY